MNTTNYIYYKKGYKYQLDTDYLIQTDICPKVNIDTDFIILTSTGLLHIKKGYAFDGPSGPAIDTSNFMRGSLEHDAFYQLMRMGKLDASFRYKVDDRLYFVCIEDGMSKIRASWVRWAVRNFAARSASPQGERTIYRAPLT